MEDQRLIELYTAREEQAIRETEQKYGRLCFRISYNILGNRGDAEECVNDTYLSVWNTVPPEHPKNFTAFIAKLARNISLKRLRFQTAQKRHAGVELSLSELEELLPDSHYREDLEDAELGRVIGAFLRSEGEEARNVFLRKYWFFDSVSEIARRYACSESKVKSMLYRTREKLKAYLKKEGISL